MSSTDDERRSDETPLSGQGEPLPDDVPFQGEWLTRDALFLYRPSDISAPVSGNVRFVAGFQAPDGEWCLGFDAALLARELGVGIDDLFSHNRAGSLHLAFAPAAATQGGNAMLYRFRVGETTTHQRVEVGIPEGRA